MSKVQTILRNAPYLEGLQACIADVYFLLKGTTQECLDLIRRRGRLHRLADLDQG